MEQQHIYSKTMLERIREGAASKCPKCGKYHTRSSIECSECLKAICKFCGYKFTTAGSGKTCAKCLKRQSFR